MGDSSGGVGLELAIMGSNFGTSQGSSTVTLNGTLVPMIDYWSSTWINVVIPAGATTGNILVTVAGVASNGVNFTVVSYPDIASLSPSSGSVGIELDITGSNFGASQGGSTVTLNGSAVPTIYYWSEGWINVEIPAGATSGNVVVTVGGVAGNGMYFTVTSSAPTITNLSPTSGSVGTSVTITGTNFGSTQSSSTVTFNGTAATPTSWGATSIVVPVPSGATTGNVVVTVGGVASNGVSFTVQGEGGSNGYTYNRAITISHTNVPNTNQTNFPVLISGTYSYLATTSNGGSVTNANGYDIIFTSDSAGSHLLNWETESYVPATGAVNFWVQIPTLSHTTDSVIYMWYGNSSVSTFQSPGSAWDGTFGGVWHLPNGATLSAKDSTTNANNGALSSSPPTATTGKIDGGASFNGSTNYITVPASASIQPTTAFTFSEWVYVPTGAGASTFMTLCDQVDGGGGMFIFYFGSGNGFEAPFVTSSGSVNLQTGSALPTNAWSLIHVTYNGSVGITYVNGVNIGYLNATGTMLYNGAELDLGTYDIWQGAPSGPFLGSQDEARVANVARSADWIATEYSNQSNPSGFYSIGSASGGGGGSGTQPTIYGLSPSSGQVGVTVTIAGTNFGSSQSSSTVTFTSTIAPPTYTVPAVITSWTASQIVVQVPDGTTTGPVVLTVNGTASNGVGFTASGGCIAVP